MLQASGSPCARCRTSADVHGPTPGKLRSARSACSYELVKVRSKAAALTAVRTRVRLRRCSTPAAKNCQLDTRDQTSGVGGRYIPYAAEPRPRVGPRAGAPHT